MTNKVHYGIYIPATLLAELRAQAEAEDRSVNSIINRKLETASAELEAAR